jgi:hypothetical protein
MMNTPEPLDSLLDRAKSELLKFAAALRAADCGGNATLKEQREGVAQQLEDRATACGIWLIGVKRGIFAPNREACVRECCAEWLRMIG